MSEWRIGLGRDGGVERESSVSTATHPTRAIQSAQRINTFAIYISVVLPETTQVTIKLGMNLEA